MKLEELDVAVSLLLDGDLPAEEFARLERALEESCELRARFIEHVDLHTVLDQRLSVPEGVQMPGRGVIPVPQLLARQKRKAMKNAALAAAAALALLGVVLKLVLVPEPEALLSFRLAKDSSFWVSHDTRGDKQPKPGTLAKGSSLQLTQGAVELKLATGVRSIVQAPAHLTLQKDDLIYLDHGLAWFEVPEKARGFQVKTPSLLVTDLGTEFGVHSSDGQFDEVHLFKGKVEVTSRYALKKTETLTGRTARVLDPIGRFKDTPLRTEKFLTTLPPTLPHVRFSFDSIEDGLMFAEGSHPDASWIAAELIPGNDGPSASPLVPGKFGQALRLQGHGDFVVTDWRGIGGRRPRTLACWVRIEEDAEFYQPAAIAGWGSLERNGKWRLHAVQRKGREGRFPRISLGIVGEFTGSTRIDDGNWHHVAIVGYGTVSEDGLPDLAIFVDGRRDELTGPMASARRGVQFELNTIIDSPLSQPLIIGKGHPSMPGSFRGELDELTIYEGALPDASIRQLAAGKARIKINR